MSDERGDLRPNYYKVTVSAEVDGERRPVVLECFDLIDALKLGFYLGNVLTYLFRVGRKTASRDADLKKIRTYGQQADDRESRST